MKTLDMEIAVLRWANPRINVVVPNISWGLFIHECDVLILTPSGYAWEIEIKVNKYDLRNDKKKFHGHHSNKIKRLYFTIPEYLKDEIYHIPERAGIIVVRDNGFVRICQIIREPQNNKNAVKLSMEDRMKVAHLGAMRILTLKQKIRKLIK